MHENKLLEINFSEERLREQPAVLFKEIQGRFPKKTNIIGIFCSCTKQNKHFVHVYEVYYVYYEVKENASLHCRQ